MHNPKRIVLTTPSLDRTPRQSIDLVSGWFPSEASRAASVVLILGDDAYGLQWFDHEAPDPAGAWCGRGSPSASGDIHRVMEPSDLATIIGGTARPWFGAHAAFPWSSKDHQEIVDQHRPTPDAPNPPQPCHWCAPVGTPISLSNTAKAKEGGCAYARFS